MPRDDKDLEAGLHDQTNLLPRKELLKVFSIMALSLCVCMIDQNSVGVLLPSISRDLHAQSSISWAGTSALIANTVFQVLYGRFSDLFGRKKVMISALYLLCISDLICGLSQNATMLYVFRGLSGVAQGGITSLSMMIVSDVVTLKERGKYQGILGTMVGLGNAIGPLIAAGFAMHTTWRGVFYLLAPLAFLAAGASWRYLPCNMPKLDLKETIKKIDFLGLISGFIAIVFILIPISDGGQELPWSSPQVIAMLTIGGISAIVFLLVEWKFAELPMMPLSMFRTPSVAAMLVQNILFGASYYTYMYYLPIYFQNVKGYSVILSAVFTLPLVICQSIFSTLSGQYISRLERYGEVIWTGYALWTLGTGLMIMCDRNTSPVAICFFLILIGIGSGFVFQPTLVALQAHSPKAQRAVIVSNRNFLRALGGSVGLAVSAGILGNVLKGSLPSNLQYIASSTYATPDFSTFSLRERHIIEEAYAKASRAVFIWCTPLLGLCFIGCILIKDNGLQRQEEKEAVTPLSEVEQNRCQPPGAEKTVGTVDVASNSETGEKLRQDSADTNATGKPSIEHEISRKPSISSHVSEKSVDR